jgi:hypothetical protein
MEAQGAALQRARDSSPPRAAAAAAGADEVL